MWAVIEANAGYTRQVAAAVEARDLTEIKRITGRANLPRRKFSSVVDRLGLGCRADASNREEMSSSQVGFDDPASVEPPLAPPCAPPAHVKVTTTGSDSVGFPVFFLDAEGRGGTTALALATVENNLETVRLLIKEVIVQSSRHGVNSFTVRGINCGSYFIASNSNVRTFRRRSIAMNNSGSFIGFDYVLGSCRMGLLFVEG